MLEYTQDLPHAIKLIPYVVFIGVGATAIMDFWTIFLKTAFNIAGLNFALVGRWMTHMMKGQFTHESIAQSSKTSGEAFIGWTAHYVIGIIYAGAVVLIWGEAWLANPTLLPALIIGVTTVVIPFFIMQPCFGMGIAGSKMPKPSLVRLKSFASHFVFGVGIYLAGLLLHNLAYAQ
ncbi:DUF2938 domain-containing protein [Hirschia litorea]|uniref:DUF2938 domain-containing protein n=1 Tax=Hirschia litorea TaxID=1199156 RepID=A0ABW2IQB4_9PROT